MLRFSFYTCLKKIIVLNVLISFTSSSILSAAPLKQDTLRAMSTGQVGKATIENEIAASLDLSSRSGKASSAGEDWDRSDIGTPMPMGVNRLIAGTYMRRDKAVVVIDGQKVIVDVHKLTKESGRLYRMTKSANYPITGTSDLGCSSTELLEDLFHEDAVRQLQTEAAFFSNKTPTLSLIEFNAHHLISILQIPEQRARALKEAQQHKIAPSKIASSPWITPSRILITYPSDKSATVIVLALSEKGLLTPVSMSFGGKSSISIVEDLNIKLLSSILERLPSKSLEQVLWEAYRKQNNAEQSKSTYAVKASSSGIQVNREEVIGYLTTPIKHDKGLFLAISSAA